ncbi:head-tail connector protein [Castellaniella hirudinis]|uniref:head-tail connector protein n=1 Tax=Castellaniella hirudinis TaxID=1144617 RepID=UPI0039C479E4
MSLKVITPPATEPVTLTEAKLHLRVDGNDENALITSLIVAARQGAEHMTGRALMPQTLELSLDDFAPEIQLPRPPLTSVTSVSYVDGGGVMQVLDSSAYAVNDHGQAASLVPAFGTSWPQARDQVSSVLIRYQAGYASASDVPQAIKSWMLIRIGTLYEHRQAVVTGVSVSSIPGIDRLLDAYRVYL